MLSAGHHRGSPGAATTLIELLEERAAAPRAGYAFLQDGRNVSAELSFPELAQRARAIAAQIRQSEAQGTRAILLYPPGLSFLPAFFGCLYARAVAIPVPPPDGARLKSTLPRLRAILDDAEPELVLTVAAVANELEEQLRSFRPGLRWLTTDRVNADFVADWQPPAQQPDGLAYLQYTSGSTTTPRGVMISHANVLHNLEYLRRGFAYDDQSISLTWMPHFHDYGLVDGLLQPLYSNIPSFLLSPLTILKRPLRWLEAISRYRATHSHGPNFSYELCLQRIGPDERSALELSSWRVACNGAEPVRADTLRRFSETFGPCGFRPETFYPGYGLAEATLFVSARRHDAKPRGRVFEAAALEQNRVVPLESTSGAEMGRRVMSCGAPQGEAQLCIVDPDTRQICPPDRVGEIWLADPSVALGYWRKPEDTRATFQARLGDDSSEREFLRTGDLGFMLDGELYVTGRLKDLIIIGGVNHYPQDIEWAVQTNCPELRRDRCVAFTIDRDNAEQLVILAEPERPQADWDSLLQRIREAVASRHEISVAAIALLKRGGILKTSSGKLQRRACRRAFLRGELATLALWEAGPVAAVPAPPGRLNLTGLQQWVCERLAAAVRLAPHEIALDTPFAEYGLDSRMGAALVAALEDRLGDVELSPALLWQYPTVSALCEHLSNHHVPSSEPVAPAAPAAVRAEAVAIVGMACRFPGAANAREFWSLLSEGRSAIVASPRLPGVKAGFLNAVEDFDADFFGISANEARAMDPQQRLLMEVAWEALENAGLPPQELAGRRGGVFIGIGIPDHGFQQFSQPDAANLISAHTGTGMAFCVAANRLSYHFNLRGPSMAIDTACSSALVAVHQACQSLKNGECDFAIAGGVNLILSPFTQLALERAGMLSPSRLCKTFDADANGYVRGEGCGLVILKRLGDALRDKDTILALVRGSAVNQDGRSNGLTAPNPVAQQAVIREALAGAGLPAGTIDYVEAHGTGTPLGDPIEMSALQTVFGDGRAANERCWVGSVKTNIGHLEAAAGIAGLMKAVLALQHAEIPPHLNLQRLNPLIKLAGTPFAIAESLQPWPQDTDGRPPRPRRAAVSSFGFGGTNAHVVLEEPPAAEEPITPRRSPERPLHLFTISARSPAALRELAGRYAAHLNDCPETPLADLCFSASAARAQLAERLALTAMSGDQLAAQLRAFSDGGEVEGARRGRAATQPPGVVFMFTGQGSQYTNMARQLYETQPFFRAVLEEGEALLGDELERPLLSVIFGSETELLNQTAYTQPSLFVLEYALARLWQRWGIEPAALVGHSLGEYVAACLAGVFSLRDGLRLVAARGRLMQRLPQDGAMLVVLADESYLSEAISDCPEMVSIASLNAPRSVALSGERSHLERLRERFEGERITCRYLQTSHAFHSPLMEPILEEFRAVAATFSYAPPRLPWLSNLTGEPMENAPDADYWTRHLRETVRFADSIRHLGQSHRLFLEIGPRPVLSGPGAQCLADAPDEAQWLPSLKPEADDWGVMLGSLAQLYVSGVTPDWRGFDQDYTRRRLAGLPAYPFQRRRFALPPPETVATQALLQAMGQNGDAPPEKSTGVDGAAQATVEVGDWGYVPQWQPVTANIQEGPAEWLLLADTVGVGAALRALLERKGKTASLVTTPLPESSLSGTEAAEPLQLVCLWGLDLPSAASLEAETLSSALAQIVSRLLSLLHQLAAHSQRGVRLWLVSRSALAGLAESGPEAVDGLLQSLLWGLGRTLRREYPDWQIRLVDLSGETEQAAEQLLQECLAADAQLDVCWRGPERYSWRLGRHRLEARPLPAPLGNTWLITGGLGHLGLKVAEWLAGRGVRHLLLVGRRPPGPEAESQLAALNRQGVSVKTCAVDVGDYAAVRELLTQEHGDWPPFEGVVHAAGVLDDGIVHQQTVGRFSAVLSPKVLGGWNLHLLTANLPLRHFILFSSASSLLGNPGQSAYAAGNAFLDSLAAYRRARGLPALSLNWSTWTEAAADPKVARQLEQHGLVPINTTEGLIALERALTLDLPQLAVVPVMAGRSLDEARQTEAGGATVERAGPEFSDLFERLRHDAPPARQAKLEAHILAQAASVLGCSPEELDPQGGFFEQGFDSLNVVELKNRLQRDLGRPLPITLAFNYPTATALAKELWQQFGPPPSAADTSNGQRPEPIAARNEGIAIISMTCRLPGGVTSPEEFWTLLSDGIDAITEVPGDRWDADAYYHPDPDHPGTMVTRRGGFVTDVEQFDDLFFGISPRETLHLDPQQRLLLEVCWETFERAGLPPAQLLGTQTGVFIGIHNNDYVRRLNRRPEEVDAYLGSGNAYSLAANRLSYVFGLEGPSLAIDTACSSSLVAIHQACQSLLGGESDMALAGGVNLLLDPLVSINHSRAHMLAPDGRCKAFSAEADGIVRSDGCGLLLLKRLSDAERDGDPILAVIRGSAVNQDGRTSGLTVPNGPAQQRVIRRALQQAALEPSAISYVEAHGTGTPLGDPIEADALTAVFGQNNKRLTVGSVKTNIGHLESAAGVAGVIKSVLALQHKSIPAHLHCESLNPRIDWEHSQLRIPRTTESWLAGPEPRRAGVSSFGFGGTNSHVILEEAPRPAERELPSLVRYLLPLSARTETALRTLAQNYVAYLGTTTTHPADICYTAACGRDHFGQRLAVLGESLADLRSRLIDWLAGEASDNVRAGSVASTTGRESGHTTQAVSAGPSDWADMASAYAQGAGPDWAACYDGLKLRRVILPGHPFERRDYAVRPPAPPARRPRLYQPHWVLQPDSRPLPEKLSDRWLILADRQGWGEALARELEGRGAYCALVYNAPAPGGRSVAAHDVAALSALLDEAGTLRGIVHLWGLDNPSPAALDTANLLEAQRHSLGSVLHLAQTLNKLPRPPRLWLLSRAAQAVVSEDGLEGLAQTPLWGLGRALALEMQLVWGGLLDLPAEAPTRHRAASICAALYDSGAETERALRAGGFYAPRLRPFAPARAGETMVRADASYLITGGFGSLGRQLGRWLFEQGARTLWLLGRRGANDNAARDYVAELRGLGVTVEVAAVDVTDEPALAAQLDEWLRIGPPLRGVIHAAGLNAETPLATLDWPTCARILAPKLQGGWALQRSTASQELDFFINCSSIAGLWGSQQQAPYSAANAFLDGLAMYRGARGQAALSINWGPLSTSTMLGEAAAAALRASGIEATPLAHSTAELSSLLGGGARQVALAAVDWERFAPLYQSRCATGLFSELTRGARPQPQPTTSVADSAAVPVNSPADLLKWLKAQLGEALRLPSERLESDVPLPRLGLDSLMAVELRNRLQERLGRVIPLTELLGGLSLNDLVKMLVGAPAVPATGGVGAMAQREWVTGEI